MRVLVTGAAGQVGRELQRNRPEAVELVAMTRDTLDICDRSAVLAAVREASPELIVNAAGYTAVDRAESEERGAFAVNADGARHLAEAATAVDARLVHLSTDFVFDGRQSRPYRPDDQPRPLSIYGRSKLAGEDEVRSTAGAAATIVRTSWVYSRFGTNFVTTMLALMDEHGELSVVSDQIGSPTWGRQLALALWEIAARPEISGTLHWSDAGVASWYDLAVAIQEIGLELDLVEAVIPIVPIPSCQYQTAAERPRFSVLDSSETRRLLTLPTLHWRSALRRMLEDLAGDGRG